MQTSAFFDDALFSAMFKFAAAVVIFRRLREA
jgi:hypothetical protein